MNNTYNNYFPKKNLNFNYGDNYQEIYKLNDDCKNNNELLDKENKNENIENNNKISFPLNNKSQMLMVHRSNTTYNNSYNLNNNNYNCYNYSNNNSNYIDQILNNNDNNIIINSNIKILRHKLDNKDTKIKSLESHIDLLNKENKSLKEYIIELEKNNNPINSNNNINNNRINNNDINSLLNEENQNINNNIEKVMASINYFIKKVYNLFPNLEKEKKFEELKFEQYNELHYRLNIIENLINDLFIQNIKKNNYSLNDNIITDISTIDYIKKGKHKPRINTIIKKLKNKSVKKLKKRNFINNDYNINTFNKRNNSQIKKIIKKYN